MYIYSGDFHTFDALPRFDIDLTLFMLISALVLHKLIFHIYMLLRLHLTFKNTHHSVTKPLLKFFAVCLFVGIILQLAHDLNEIFAFHPWLYHTIYIYMTIDSALSIVLIYLFRNKLLKLVMMNRYEPYLLLSVLP